MNCENCKHGEEHHSNVYGCLVFMTSPQPSAWPAQCKCLAFRKPEKTEEKPAPIEPSSWFYKKVIERGEKERKALAEDNARLAQALAKSVMDGPPVGKSATEIAKEAEIEKLKQRLNKSGVERETLAQNLRILEGEVRALQTSLTNVRNDLVNSENAFKDVQRWREQEIAVGNKALKRAEAAEAALKTLATDIVVKAIQKAVPIG